MTRRRVAAIDCGTNTLRLLIADVDPADDAPVRQVVREMRTVRLGQGIERTGRFADEALQRVQHALDEYAALIAEHHAPSIRMVATSASRDVTNRTRLIEIVQSTLGIEPEVISGDEEGSLTFRGVLSGLAVREPSVVVDVGGGSTELVVGDRASMRAAVSMNIGVVRLTERHVRSDPPLPAELEAVARDTSAALRGALARIGDVTGHAVIGVAGTATTAIALAHDLPGYDPKLIHGGRASYADLERVRDWTCSRDTAGRAEHPAMHPGRAGVFPAGMVILLGVLRALDASELIVSESDILDGIALSIA